MVDNRKERCRYELRQSERQCQIVARCSSCDGKGDLTEKRCFSGMLDALSQETNVNAVILSHYFERMYKDDGLEVLSRIVRIGSVLDQFASRNPLEHFQGEREKGRYGGLCRKCDVNPQKLFSDLKNSLFSELKGFYKELGDRSKSLMSFLMSTDRTECRECVSKTSEDFVYVFNRLEEFRAFVMLKGFQVVL